MAKTAWRCSQCGAVNEPGARACRDCGKWPSLFDLQDSAVEDEGLDRQTATFGRRPAPDPEVLEPELFDPRSFEPDVSEPNVLEPNVLEPDVFERESDEPEERQGRFPRWVVTAVWMIGILVWIVANALGDRG